MKRKCYPIPRQITIRALDMYMVYVQAHDITTKAVGIKSMECVPGKN